MQKNFGGSLQLNKLKASSGRLGAPPYAAIQNDAETMKGDFYENENSIDHCRK